MKYGSFQNMMAANVKAKPQFEVGDGATLVMWTDCHACTLIEVRKNRREIVIQEDTVTRIDKNGMSESQNYSFSPNPNGTKHVATLRKNGTFKVKGQQTGVLVGDRSHYYDYSF